MTRSLSRIRAIAALALAVAAVAAPAALADTPVGDDQLSIDAAAAAPVYWATPDAGPSTAGATSAARTPAPPARSSGNVDAAVIVVLTLFAAGAIVAMHLRRRSLAVT